MRYEPCLLLHWKIASRELKCGPNGRPFQQPQWGNQSRGWLCMLLAHSIRYFCLTEKVRVQIAPEPPSAKKTKKTNKTAKSSWSSWLHEGWTDGMDLKHGKSNSAKTISGLKGHVALLFQELEIFQEKLAPFVGYRLCFDDLCYMYWKKTQYTAMCSFAIHYR